MLVLALALAVPFLFGSSEEQSAAALSQAKASIAAGDDDTAVSLLGTALRLDPENLEARRTLAAAFLRQGKTGPARSLFDELVTRDPQYLDGLIALATIAYTTYDFSGGQTYVAAALAISPEDTEANAIAVALKVEEAIQTKDPSTLAEAESKALEFARENPDNLMALRAAVRATMNGQDPASAIPLVDHAIELTKGRYDFEELRLAVLQKAGEKEAAVDQIERMFHAFPERSAIGDWLFSILDSRDDYEGARQVLFEAAQRADFGEEPTDKLLDYVRRKGQPGDVLATLEMIIAAAPDLKTSSRYVLAVADLQADEGHPDAALERLQALLNSGADVQTIAAARTMMARIYLAQGKAAEAQDLVREVLATAPETVSALKLQARIELDADNASQALTALQSALDQSPRDSEVMLLLAEAYEKSGALPLAGERFALAVEYSNHGVDETLQAAAFQVRMGRSDRAIEMLNQALQANPDSIPLRAAAARAYASQFDWVHARQMIDALTAIGTPEALAAADQSRDVVISTQTTLGQTRLVIDRILAEGPGKTSDATRAVDRMIDQGKPDTALTYLLDPARGIDPAMTTLRAMLFALNGKTDQATEQLRAILKTDPTDDLAFLALYGLLDRSGQTDAAIALLDGALSQPEPPIAALLQAADNKAAAGNVSEAIALTRTAYDRDPGDKITAALLARRIVLDPKATADDLREARDIAAPLRSLDRPLVLDTLGWVEVRLGTPAAGLSDLQTAGRLLPDDPTVRFHLAMALFALDRQIEAKDALKSYLAMTGTKAEADVAEAKAILQKLETGG
ncbi:tetratricopeptide repeat protein [Allitabrizicola rongguiensis]|uniref:tetratricopeptide repeat protein n=1 Tax=Alitabrizicola rongguiensis TaxID=2909234 RepID=UPI001F47058C|nr:tetratricopeptide repeat protein [Tabrizicola rongguiensis]